MASPVAPVAYSPAGNVAQPGWSWRRLVLPALAGLAVLGFLVDIALGSVAIPIKDVFRIVIGQGSDNTAWLYIVQNIRLPKALTAVIRWLARLNWASRPGRVWVSL